MDLEFGPDGALYVLDYGTGWFGGDANSALYRIEYNSARRPGAGRRRVAPPRPAGNAPLTVQFSSAGTGDPDGDPHHLLMGLHHERQHRLHRGQPVVHLHQQRRVHRDADGAGQHRPQRHGKCSHRRRAADGHLNLPLNGRVFNFGDADPVPGHRHRPERTDHRLQPGQGQLRPRATTATVTRITSATGCSGTLQTTVDGEHDAEREHLRGHDGRVHPSRLDHAGPLTAGGPAAADPPGRALQRPAGRHHRGQAIGQRRQRGRVRRERRLDLVHAVQPERRHVVHRAGRLGRLGRHDHPAEPARPPGR